MRFEARRVVFWSLSCYKKLKLTTNPFTGCALHSLLIQMQNIYISLRSSGMRRKQNFEISFLGLKVTQSSWLLLFTFSPPLFFRFSCLIFFFSLAGHLAGFILVGTVLRNAFRILGLGEKKGRWAMEHGFLPFSLVSLTELCSFWYGLKDLFTLHKLADKVGLDR